MKFVDTAAQPANAQPAGKHPPSGHTRPNPSDLARGWLPAAGRIILAAVLVFLLYKVVRVGYYGFTAYRAGQAILSLRHDGDFDAQDLRQAALHAAVINRAVTGAAQESEFLHPPLSAAAAIPAIGPTLAAIPNLIDVGRDSVDLGYSVLELVAQQTEHSGDLPLLDLLMAAMQAQPDRFGALSEQMETIHQTLARIPAKRLISPLRGPIAQSQAATELASVGLAMAPSLPKILGFGEPQTYLLLVQNNQELRATGGFISAAGTVTLRQARPENLALNDSYSVTRDDVNHPSAPEPLQTYMDIELIFLRDANWSPDFPTTAQLAQSLYAQDAGVRVDGVIALDLHAVEHLVAALGTLHVPGSDEEIRAENLVQQLQSFWDQPIGTDDTIQSAGHEWLRQRKDFMPILAKAALERIESGDVNPLALAAGVHASLDVRGLQVWLEDAEAAAHLAARGWDGGLRAEETPDFVALVDTNMGYNKVDAVLQRSLDYTITWPDGPDAPAQATVRATYHHPLQVANPICEASSIYGDSYTDMIERCYFDYVRLYVPAGSQLVALDGVMPGSTDTQPGEDRTQIFAGYFTLEPGDSHTITFTYRLPPTITPDGYSLGVQRQAGSGDLPVTLTLQAGDRSATRAMTLTSGYLRWEPAP